MTETHREYFNRIAGGWDEMASPMDGLKKYLDMFGVKPGDAILDAGAGTGRLTKVLVDRVGPEGKVVGVDFAENMLKQAKRRCGESTFKVCSDISRLSFRTGTFDKIVCFSCFPHFSDKPAVLAEMVRVLKPGGKLLILHTCSSRKLNAFHSTLAGPVAKDRLPAASKAARLLKSAGFDVSSAFENKTLYWVEGVKAF
jgi:ubiquinone/menaquinone biosynthesis C-methylase UbiE